MFSSWCIFLFLFNVGLVTSQGKLGEVECPADHSRLEVGRICRKSCTKESDCKGARKQCRCDNVCGFSCFNPNATCVDLPDFPNGRVTGLRTYGHAVTYTCDQGHFMVGAKRRTCWSNKKWSGQAPVCKAGCYPPKDGSIAFANAYESTYNIGDTVEYICRYGYRLQGSPIVTCKPDGTWKSNRFSCVKVTCRFPEVPLHTSITGNQRTFGSRVRFTCDKGYELSQAQDYVVCGVNGQWRGTIPSCRAVRCPAPSAPENGAVDDSRSDYSYSTSIIFSCGQGYKLVGRAEATCNENKTWGAEPKCTVDKDCDFEDFTRPLCGFRSLNSMWIRTFSESVPNGERGYIAKTKFVVGGSTTAILESPSIPRQQEQCLRFYYKVNYLSRTNNFIAQLKNTVFLWKLPTRDVGNAWLSTDVRLPAHVGSSVVQFVVASDASQRSMTSIEIDDVSILADEECINECRSKPCQNGGKCLNLIGGFKCYCPAGYLGLRCESKICPLLSITTHLRIQSQKQVYIQGDEVEYRCIAGYQLQGNSILSCQSNGRWSRSLPTCSKICQLRRLTNNLNIELQKPVYIEGDTVKYTCEAGYHLRGSSILRCQSSGDWTRSPPTCSRICRLRPLTDNLKIQSPNQVYIEGNRVEYTCAAGYYLQGISFLRCQSNGFWSRSPPTCSKICRMRPLTNGLKIQPRKPVYIEGNRVEYTCAAGYQLRGISNLRCQSNGVWSRPPPTCSRICRLRPLTDNLKIQSRKQVYIQGNDVEYTCSAGYHLQGSSILRCQSNGVWSRSPPTCSKICHLNPLTNKLKIQSQKQVYIEGNEVEYTCNDGYQLQGSSVVRCQSNGFWSTVSPTCLKICSLRPLTNNLKIQSQKRVYIEGNEVEYTCNDGYQLKGNSILRCQSNGLWSRVPPTCFSTAVPVGPVVSVEKDCPNGFTHSYPMCYKILSDKMGYTQAVRECSKYGATLPIIRRSGMQNTIVRFMRAKPFSSYWLGLDRNNSQRELRWASDVKFSQNEFRRFQAGQFPNNSSQCFSMLMRSQIWVSNDCEIKGVTCVKWQSQVTAVDVKLQDSDDATDGIYFPIPGVLYYSFPIYQKQNSSHKLFTRTNYLTGRRRMMYIGLSLRSPVILRKSTTAKFPQDITGKWADNDRNLISVAITGYDAWDEWSKWSLCSLTCGKQGTSLRIRRCRGYEPSSQHCPGLSSETRGCSLIKCPLKYGDKLITIRDDILMSFGQARTECQKYGGDLATIKTEDNQKFIQSNLKNNTKSYFIGMRGNTTTNWYWLDGERVNAHNTNPGAYSKWTHPEPNNYNSKEECGSMGIVGRSRWYWNDLSCSNKEFFICEQTDYCFVNPCLNGNCVNNVSNYSCTCHEGFRGTNCEIIEPQKCPTLTAPVNGHLALLNESHPMFQVGSVVQFTCDLDYRLVGEAATICGDDAQWSNPVEPTCREKGCKILNFDNRIIAQGFPGREYEIGDTLEASCENHGEEIFTVKCLGKEKWSPNSCWSSWGNWTSCNCTSQRRQRSRFCRNRNDNCPEGNTTSTEPCSCNEINPCSPNPCNSSTSCKAANGNFSCEMMNATVLPEREVGLENMCDRPPIADGEVKIAVLGELPLPLLKATYSCNVGFRLVGVKENYCVGNGWKPADPVCKPNEQEQPI